MSLFFEKIIAHRLPLNFKVVRGDYFLAERKEFSEQGSEELLSVSEYSGVTPRRESLSEGEHLSRAESLEGYRLVKVGDLVMNYMLAWKGAQGVSAHEGITSPAYSVFKIDSNKADKNFIHHLFRSDLFKQYFRSESSGIIDSRLRFYPESLKSLKVGLPSLAVQENTSRYLDRETARIDALVEKKTRFIELLREKRQALITHAVTKGLDPKVKMKDSGVEWLGEVPEHWMVKRLKFIATVQTGVAKGKDTTGAQTVEVPYLRVANVQDGYLDLSEVATIEITASDLPRYLLQPGDVLMNEGGDFDKLGRGHVWNGEVESCIHQNHVFAVRPHGVASRWLNTFTSSAAAQFYFMGRSKQSTNLASISSSNLMELAVPLPPDVEQKAILDQLALALVRLDSSLQKTERSIELLKERRSALITAAVTGQIDLREAA